jgi:hypothetical protein
MIGNNSIEFEFRGTLYDVVVETPKRFVSGGRSEKTYLVTDRSKKQTWRITGLKVSKLIYNNVSEKLDERNISLKFSSIVARDVQEFFNDLIDEFCDLHDL